MTCVDENPGVPRVARVALRVARAALAALIVACGGAAAQTYTSASTSYNFIDAAKHTKVGYKTAPYQFNGSAGCGTSPPYLDDEIGRASCRERVCVPV